MQSRLLISSSEYLQPKRYFALFTSLIGLTVLGPLVEHEEFARHIVGGLMMMTVMLAALSVSASRKLTFIVLMLAVIAAATWVLAFVVPSPLLNKEAFEIASYAANLIFVTTICGIIRKDIYSGAISANRVCGAVCVYILIGFCFAMIHMMILTADQSAYCSSCSRDQLYQQCEVLRSSQRYPIFVYFSFSTLTFAGFGDVVPVSRIARTVSWLEALCGQLYLAVMMARLVGMHIAGIDPTKPKEL